MTWEFDDVPDLTSLEVRTRPSDALTGDRGGSRTAGFGLVSWQRHEIPIHDVRAYEFTVPRATAYQVMLAVDLVAELADGTTCESLLFTEVEHSETTEEERRLTVPYDITVDRSRYAGLVFPEPTLEALVFAFAEYTGPHGMGDTQPDYSQWTVPDHIGIRDYEPALRHFLFGSTQGRGDWETAAHLLEILAVFHPDLDPRFATSIDEVNFPQFHPLCERWVLDEELDKHRPCQRSRNSANFDGSSTQEWSGNPGYREARGWTYHNTWVVDAEDLERPDARDDWSVGQIVRNPCCSINVHEVGHAMGLSHTYCAHSAMARWEDRPYMTTAWSAEDLAGIAIHLDPRTTHGMNIREAAEALGIEQDDHFDDMLASPWRACGRQDSGWNDFADRIYEDHVLSTNLGTNHPDNRTPILYDR